MVNARCQTGHPAGHALTVSLAMPIDNLNKIVPVIGLIQSSRADGWWSLGQQDFQTIE
jgi:hypothetical protein